MTTNASINKTPLAMKGDTKLSVRDTSWLLRTPAPVATKPLMSVARPIIAERSDSESASDDAEDMSHDSKAENNMDVEMPPRTRPTRRIGSHRIRTQAQVKV